MMSVLLGFMFTQTGFDFPFENHYSIVISNSGTAHLVPKMAKERLRLVNEIMGHADKYLMEDFFLSFCLYKLGYPNESLRINSEIEDYLDQFLLSNQSKDCQGYECPE